MEGWRFGAIRERNEQRHPVNRAYWEILRVFFAVFKSSIPNGMAEAVEVDMLHWLEDYKKTMKDRAPWIPDVHKLTL